MKPNDHNGHDDTRDADEIVRRTDYDATEPLDNPAFEAIAQFFAAPSQFRQFSSVVALAGHLGISRMTIYRWSKDVDVVQRIEWLLRRSMRSGDLIAAREWRAIVEAQVRAAIAGDTRAAVFCQNRAWSESLIPGGVITVPAVGGADAIAMWQERTEPSEGEKLEANENLETEGKKASE
jgi:hypothetical protein